MGRRLKLLLDTHALIWWAIDDPNLSRRVRALLGRPGHTVYVSAASAWEIATKARLGKLQWPEEAGSVESYIRLQGFDALPISVEHAERAGNLAIAHRDPFDRMLIAQATTQSLVLASNEALFDGFGVRRLW
ncbi:MAG: type II toxin-antitoxin system VapC family toxin [Solirubrobacterales bacterium]|nr:type II toxin-antitoxin system VapC family toxin [Solirubrobacterales bacterium]